MESAYQNPPKTTRQQDLFEDPKRWPRRPYCTDDLASGLRIRTLRSALTRAYIQANPPHLRVWSIFDVDRPGAGILWDDVGLPPPTWAAINRQNAHAHLVWGLTAPVLVEAADARRAPIRYLLAVESAIRGRLQADPGYGGLITKNPAHPLWKVLRGPRSYDLGELSEWVELPKHLPKQGVKFEEVGLGRNCTLFEWLRKWAYTAVRKHRDHRNFVLWQAQVYDRALERNGEFASPMDYREVFHIAKSVTKWVWKMDSQAEAAFLKRQAWKGAKSGEVRRLASEGQRASARLMAATGLSTRRIADELEVDQSTVVRWLRTPSEG
jgi:hypothetical protein